MLPVNPLSQTSFFKAALNIVLVVLGRRTPAMTPGTPYVYERRAVQ